MLNLTDIAAPTPHFTADLELARVQVGNLVHVGDLDDYLHDTSTGVILRHPLCVTLFFEEQRDTYTDLLARMAQQVADKLEKQPRAVVNLFAKPYRLDGLLAVAPALDDKTFWESAGSVWQAVEWPSQQREDWESLFLSTRPGREAMMSERDRNYLARLPATFTVWRGIVIGEEQDGMSWTVDPEQAQWFAERNAKIFQGEPDVISRVVNKDDVIAYLSGRGESEVIII